MERVSEKRSCLNSNMQFKSIDCSKIEINSATQSNAEMQAKQRMDKQHKLFQRRWNSSFNMFQSFIFIIFCSLIIASFQEVLLDITSIKSETRSSRSFIPLFTGAHALAVRRDAVREDVTIGASSKASLSPVVRSSFARSNNSRVEKQSSTHSGGNGSASSILQQHGKSQQPLMRTKAANTTGSSSSSDVSDKNSSANNSIASVPVQRWGHSVTYLKDAKVALFVGGVVPSASGESVLSNSVFALDLSINATQQWTHLISDELAPHAFAARAIAYDVNNTVERITILGGSTDDCSANASQVFVWQMGQSWRDGQWSIPKLDSPSDAPTRRRGMQAVQVPVQIGEKGANATQLQREGGVSYMLLGGISDESTCSKASDLYPDVDIWTMGASTRGASKVIDSNSSLAFDTRTLMLAKQMTNVSLADYSSVVIPGQGSESDLVLMLGGIDETGELASFDEPWIYNLTSALWSRMATRGDKSDVPSGRVGHTTTMTSNGTIIVYGGFTSLTKNRQPSSDVFVLDLSTEPATWSKMKTTNAPTRAFHTAFMAGDFMVVGFGMTDDVPASGNAANASIDNGQILPTRRAVNTTAYQAIQILDTSSDNGWIWSDNMSEAVAVRAKANVATSIVAKESAIRAAAAVASTSSSTRVSAPTTAAVTVPTSSTPLNRAASSQSASVAASAQSIAASQSSARASASANAKKSPVTSDTLPPATSAAAVASGASTMLSSSSSVFTNPFTSTAMPSSTNSNASGSAMTPATRNTAVIASVFGAAALAAGLAVLYALYKRREAKERGAYDDRRYEHQSFSDPGPPVSALFLNQQPVTTWAGTASKNLKHKASQASVALLNRGKEQSPVTTPRGGMMNAPLTPVDENYTSPFPVMSMRSNSRKNQGFQVLSNLPASSRLSIRRNELREQEAIRNKLKGQEQRSSALGFFPEEFTHKAAINEDDEEQQFGDGKRGTFGDVSPRQRLSIPKVAFTRTGSSESLGSVGGASHLSYPYLGSHQNVISFGGGGGASNTSSPYIHQGRQLEPASPSYILESQANKAATLTGGNGFPFRSLIEENDQFSTGRPSIGSSHANSHYEEAMAAAEAAVAGRRESRRPSAWMRQAMQTSLPPSEEGSPTLDPFIDPSSSQVAPLPSSMSLAQQDRRGSRQLSAIQQGRRESRQEVLLRVVNEGQFSP